MHYQSNPQCKEIEPPMISVTRLAEIARMPPGHHGFSKSQEYAKRCVGMGIFLSVGHRALTADNPELFETIKQTPIEWVLTKTASDDPEGFLKLT